MRFIPILIALVATFALHAQVKQPPKKKAAPQKTVTHGRAKYPSLLWEITGNGMKKPSYLFGTMHVSDKLAFHLSDSFYNAIRSVEVVALETNPEDWQEDFSKSLFTSFAARGNNYFQDDRRAGDLMSVSNVAIGDYTEVMKASLSMEPSLINGMLYRNMGNRMEDFQEDTYLDLYIMQVGKKLGKRLTGVENFEESEKLVIEAYIDMMKDKNKKRRSYDYDGMMSNPQKLEDAYRSGDLDLLDSLQALTVSSDAFQEKFLYKRNEIQANSIDSIIRKSTLFVGVGAAHLPGERGVIEMLRDKGYKLRPIIMKNRSSVQKDNIEKIKYPHSFQKQTADDKFYEVSIPGSKLYRFTDWPGIDIVQYADMVNGAYYTVSRVKTNALFFGHDPSTVHHRLDSLFYENIPGKIIKKTAITKNGYKGWDILNRTRRGDYQRYNIFVTPFEVIVFKIGASGDYVNTGNEAQQFFNSVKLKPFDAEAPVLYQPPTGGFKVQFPHPPSLLKDKLSGSDRLEYAAMDKKDGSNYLVMQFNRHNYSYLEEDTFDINLLEESYGSSSFIDRQLNRRNTMQNGYPALEATYLHKNGDQSSVRYIVRGPVYYTVVATYKGSDAAASRFLNSFQLTPVIYPKNKTITDTSMHFAVQVPDFWEAPSNDLAKQMEDMYIAAVREQEEETNFNSSVSYNHKYRYFGNDSLGERISVRYSTPYSYRFISDTATVWKYFFPENERDTVFIYSDIKKETLSDGTETREIAMRVKGSSRAFLRKSLHKDGHWYHLTAITDTLNEDNGFVKTFFRTFRPSDNLKTEPMLKDKSAFFADYFSSDSAISRKARRSLQDIEFDSADVKILQEAIGKLTWKNSNYLSVKGTLFQELGYLKGNDIVPFLVTQYKAVGDTAALQHKILQALLNQRTKESFTAFKDLMLEEPPVVEGNDNSSYRYDEDYTSVTTVQYGDDGGSNNWRQLHDTLALTKIIFPDFLQLLNLDDYEDDVAGLLTRLVDSGHINAKDYEPYFTKFYLDGKQLLKKQMAKEARYSLNKASEAERKTAIADMDDDDEEEVLEMGNAELDRYATLLLPFYTSKPVIPPFFEQLMKTTDRQLLYSSFLLLLRNGYPVPDSLFMKYAALDDYRIDLYRELEDMKKLDKFPSKYKTQEEIAKSLFVSRGYKKADTMIYMGKLPVTYEGQKGYVHFMKYRQMRDDDFWQIASLGFQPEDTTKIIAYGIDLVNLGDRKLSTDKPEQEQLHKFLKELLITDRESAENFYENRSKNMYEKYMSQMVKNQRYRD